MPQRRDRFLEKLLGTPAKAVPEVLPDRDIMRFLNGMLHDSCGRQNGVIQAAVARALGMAKSNLNRVVADYRPLTDFLRERLTRIIRGVASGELAFVHVKDAKGTRQEAVWLEPPVYVPFPQPPVVPLEDWRYWARCRVCGTRRYVLVEPQPLAVCFDCTPDPRLVGGWLSRGRLPLPPDARIIGGTLAS